MVTRNVSFAEGEFYHLYNRGVEKRVIYNDENDYSRFIDLLYLCNTNESINVRNVRRMNKSIFDFER